MNENDFFKNIANQHSSSSIGISFTITDEGETSWSLDFDNHSIPIADSDAHVMTIGQLAKKYILP